MSGDGRTAIVTGATGFIGRALLPCLLDAGWSVQAWVRAGSSGALPDHDRVSRIEMPAAADSDLGALLAHAGGGAGDAVDTVINLASAGAQTGGAGDAEQLRAVNEHLPGRLLRAVAAGGCGRFLQIGSCFELRDGTPGELMADDHPIAPHSEYSAAKAAGAAQALRLGAELGVPVTVLRLFGCYGPGEAPQRLLPYLIATLRRGETAELTSGAQTRDFSWVEDIAAALTRAAGADDLAAGAHYNVCSGEPVTVRELAELAAAECGRPDLLRFGARPPRDGEPAWLVGDPSRFRAATGWRPKVALAEGVARMCRAATP